MITILATDLDGTLVGDDSSMQKFITELREPLKSKQVKLVYVTGRSPELFEKLKRAKGLLEPDALITAVGTEIYIKGKRLAYWPNIYDWEQSHIKAVLRDYKGLEEQPASEQRDYKISYFYNDDPQIIDEIRRKLGSNYQVIYSGNLYLDILPSGINKGSAIEFMYNFWQLPKASVIACGDSENDIAMLKRYRAIIVANANRELMTWYEKNKNPEIYVSKSSYASGVIEGLVHFGVLK